MVLGDERKARKPLDLKGNLVNQTNDLLYGSMRRALITFALNMTLDRQGEEGTKEGRNKGMKEPQPQGGFNTPMKDFPTNSVLGTTARCWYSVVAQGSKFRCTCASAVQCRQEV